MLLLFGILLFFSACTPEKQPESMHTLPKKNTSSISHSIVYDTTQSQIIAPESHFEKSETSDQKTTILRRFESVGTLSDKNLLSVKPKTQPQSKKLSRNFPTPLQNDDYQTLNSLNRYLIVRLDNDILAEADYYYTNGISIGMIHPAIQHFAINRVLPGLGRHAIMYNGLTINHKMFTPRNPEATEIDYNDRPFAGSLYVEFFKISLLPAKKLKLYVGLRLGMIGKASLAAALQRSIHQLDPTGWQFQIADDIILNLEGSISKTLLRTNLLEIQSGASAGMGTYKNYGGLEAEFRIGHFTDSDQVFYTAQTNTLESKFNRYWQFWWYLRPSVKYVFYDATLNGGLFNHESPHKFSRADLQHGVFMLETGLTVFFKQHGLGLKYIRLSPEFKQGSSHVWGGISYIYNF